MSIFTTILEKLGLAKPGAAAGSTAKPAAPAGTAPRPAGSAAPSSMPMPPSTPASKPTPVGVVDVVSKLDKMAGDSSGLDWKVSIVDLLKLLKMDSSLNARKELAQELGCPPDLIGGDYSKMNVWLHKTVLQKIADNGGNIPTSLLS